MPRPPLARWAMAALAAPLAITHGLAQTLPTPAGLSQAAPRAPADGSPTIPDRRPGQVHQAPPNLQAGDLSLNESGAQYRSESRDARIGARFGRDWGGGGGSRIDIDYARLLGDTWAVGANVSAGTEHQELMLNGLYSPTKDLHLGLSLGWLRDTDTYRFYSGPDDVAVDQTAALLRVIKRFDQGSWLTQLNASAYATRAHKPDVPDAVMVEETPTLIRFLVDPREIAPGRLQGFNLGVGLAPWANAEFKLTLGRETLHYRFQDGSSEKNTRTTTGLGYTHALPGCWQLEGQANTGVAGDRLSFGVRHGKWHLALARDGGAQGMKPRTSLMMGLEAPLDGRASRCSTLSQRQTSGVRRLDEVFQRPRELPTRVLAKVDLTAVPVLLASLDKSGLGGSTVSATPDALIIKLPVPAVAVAQVSLNGAPSTNLGSDGKPLVWVQDGSLYLGIRRFPNPGAGATTPVSVVVVMSDASLILVDFNAVGY
ncbi:MAG TPA: hypothetical protein VLG41_20285 [Hydrogenophaga sp.]|uniref:hypothetical protein n=1 Tax=Hydrogenophaga sp. TaxID=1904254 RepID=UPI002C93B1BF|nr:hypothetical protein [Hydrogenophaga sp.]HSX95275.1 hypothetical protein [Hydrogenophaga sp.]